MLNYSLFPNLLTDRPDDYSAQVLPALTYTREQIIDLMLRRGTLTTKTDVVAVLNNLLTPGGVVMLWGSNLKIGGDNPDMGLWFVPETGNAVKAEVIITNKPASLIAMIPATLTPGNYTLRVTTQFNGTRRGLIAPRVSTYDRVLVVS